MIKKKRQNFAFEKQREEWDRNLQREGAEEASLYQKQKTHFWRQGKTTQGKKFIDF